MAFLFVGCEMNFESMTAELMHVNSLKEVRETILFPFTAEEVGRACEMKIAYHEGREAHWREEARKLEAEFREKGIEFKDIPEVMKTVSNSYRGEFGLNIDSELREKVVEASLKTKEHLQKKEDYNRYKTAFERLNDDIHLTINDMAFFGL